jgi:hypothetical protein
VAEGYGIYYRIAERRARERESESPPSLKLRWTKGESG